MTAKKIDLRDYYLDLWSKATIKPDKAVEVKLFTDLALKGKDRYMKIQDELGIPWWFIAGIHGRECAFNFKTCLHNGDALPGPTKRVPKDRGPFADWEHAAFDAMLLMKLDGFKTWGVLSALDRWERYNGRGYIIHRPDINTPYLWSFTSLYDKGKYSHDGKFDPELRDKQVGLAAYLIELIKRGEIKFYL